MLTVQPIDLPIEAEEYLDEMVAESGKSKDFHVREAILEYISEHQDIRLAEQRMDNVDAGRSYTIPHEEVMKRYDMAS